jgi:hypothetical protein
MLHAPACTSLDTAPLGKTSLTHTRCLPLRKHKLGVAEGGSGDRGRLAGGSKRTRAH